MIWRLSNVFVSVNFKDEMMASVTLAKVLNIGIRTRAHASTAPGEWSIVHKQALASVHATNL